MQITIRQLAFIIATFITKSKLGKLIQGIRDDEDRIRFLGYNVETYKLFVFVISAIISDLPMEREARRRYKWT